MDRMITANELDNWFTYHSPTLDQQHKYAAIREAAKHLATVICASCPSGADTTAAVRKVREAAMMGNQAIACGNDMGNEVNKMRDAQQTGRPRAFDDAQCGQTGY